MINRWILTEEQKAKIVPMIKMFLNKLENMTEEEVEAAPKETFVLDLYNIGVGPYLIKEILEEEFEYEEYASDQNGWEMDFWISFDRKDDKKFPSECEHLELVGCGMTFDLKLQVVRS